MKTLLLSLLISTNLYSATMGGELVDSKTNDKLGITCLDSSCIEGNFTINEKVVNSDLQLALDDYQGLYYTFNMLIITASTSRLPFPQVWHIMNMRKVTKKLRKAFPLMVSREDVNKSVKMSHKNFLEVIKAIKNY